MDPSRNLAGLPGMMHFLWMEKGTGIDLEINLVMASKDNAGIFSICSSGCGINIDDRSVIAIRLALSRSGTSLLYVCIHACRRQDQGNSHKLIDSWLD